MKLHLFYQVILAKQQEELSVWRDPRWRGEWVLKVGGVK